MPYSFHISNNFDTSISNKITLRRKIFLSLYDVIYAIQRVLASNVIHALAQHSKTNMENRIIAIHNLENSLSKYCNYFFAYQNIMQNLYIPISIRCNMTWWRQVSNAMHKNIEQDIHKLIPSFLGQSYKLQYEGLQAIEADISDVIDNKNYHLIFNNRKCVNQPCNLNNFVTYLQKYKQFYITNIYTKLRNIIHLFSPNFLSLRI